MSILIKGMKMPKECLECKWFYFQGISCTEPRYYLDARCKLLESGQDWYGEDARGGWIGESIEHIPGWGGYYSHKHCVEDGTRANQCPLVEIPPHGRLIDERVSYDKIAEQEGGYYMDMDGVGCGLEETPTVFEAEGDEE